MDLRKSALVALSLFAVCTAQADTSANLGFASDYYYRGIFQAPNSVSGGFDFEKSGLYVGTWAADVKDGLYALTLEKAGFYGKYAGFSQAFAGEYFEAGFSTTIAELDVGIAAIFANSDLVGTSDESLVLSIGKSFDLK